MKKVKKLSLKKETVAILENNDMVKLTGGYNPGSGNGGGSGLTCVAACNTTSCPSQRDNTCTRWRSDGYVC